MVFAEMTFVGMVAAEMHRAERLESAHFWKLVALYPVALSLAAWSPDTLSLLIYLRFDYLPQRFAGLHAAGLLCLNHFAAAELRCWISFHL